MKTTNRAASVRARLLNRAKAKRADDNLMSTRYSLERPLYRLSVQFPALLGDIAPPSLRAYPVYTVIAEKYEAIHAPGGRKPRRQAGHAQAVEAVRVLKPVPCLIRDGGVSNIRIATAVQKRIIVLHLHTTSLAVGRLPLNLIGAAGYSGTSARQRQISAKWQGDVRRCRWKHHAGVHPYKNKP